MPLYEYECEACGQRFEVIQKFSDPHLDVCTKCGKGPIRRLLSSPAIQFKGSGWYVTDYAQKGKSEGGSSGKSSTSTEKGSKSEPAKSDSAATTTPATTSSSGDKKD